jgi:hypothetical protein
MGVHAAPAFPHSFNAIERILFSYRCVFMARGAHACNTPDAPLLIFRQNPEGLPHIATIRYRLLQPPAPPYVTPPLHIAWQLRHFVNQSQSALTCAYKTDGVTHVAFM